MRDRWWGHGQSYANETLFSFSFFFLPTICLLLPPPLFWPVGEGEKQQSKILFLFLRVFSLVMDVAQHVSLSVCGEDVFFCGSNQLSFNLTYI